MFEAQHPRGIKLLEDENITLEILRKIQDKKFEVDLEYERTRDLFEKQRVIDPYLVEHEEDNLVLHGYY
jgi:predicted DNA-binding transcriptional regulator YafY